MLGFYPILFQEKSFMVTLEAKAIQDLIEITGQQEHNLYIDTEKLLEGSLGLSKKLSVTMFSTKYL